MEPEYALLVAMLLVSLALDAAALAGVLAAKVRAKRSFAERVARTRRVNRLVQDGDGSALARELDSSPRETLAHLRRLLESASPGPNMAAAIRAALASFDLGAYARPLLRSRALHRRVEGYQVMGLLEGPGAQAELLGALAGEGRRLGRLVALGQIARNPSIPDFEALIARLEEGSERDRRREIAMLAPLAPRLRDYFARRGPPPGPAGLALYLMTARACPLEADWDRLSWIALARDDEAGSRAAEILAERFPARRFLEAFMGRPERRFRLPAARLLGRSLGPGELGTLDPWFSDEETRGAGIAAAADVLAHHPGSEADFLRLVAEGDPARGSALSVAIEHRLPSILYHAAAPLEPGLRAMLRALVAENRAGALLEAFSSPMPAPVRAEFAAVLRAELPGEPGPSAFLARNLGPEAREELGLGPPPPEPNRSRIPISARDKVFIAGLIAIGLAIFPLAFVLWRGPSLSYLSSQELLYRFSFDLQVLFAFYTVAANGAYVILLLLSAHKLRSEALLWETDVARGLAGAGALPSISIIAPAHDEEKTIVESVHSLFSLAYPSYEVIVVNDGSKDGTLEAMISAFGLEAAAASEPGTLPCMPIRAVYRSRDFPNLTVVDKANGGKADALNAGLNRARSEFICTIDADSILDPQSLLRAMLQVVASEREVVGIGGNVFPVNGCAVEHGHLQGISVPEDPIARFQVVEYLRSFVAGRLGWARIGGLLVISGAFGTFKTQAVMEVGGFLTGEGSFRRDTVGEDMEIVVRITRKEREARSGGRIEYAYNANCWTEVPERLKALRAQRDRWHRGLMEVLCMHRGMTFRPRYGAAGMITLPYLFVFEVVGPWLETLGYAALAVILALNLIDPLIPLTVFGVAVAFGAAISIASFLLAERQILYFQGRDFARLLATAIVESFGFRQVVSAGRVISNLQFFFLRKGWGAQTRKGFSRAPSPRRSPA